MATELMERTTGLVPRGETAASAVAAQAKAMVLARYELALMRPRNLDEVRVRLLRECRRSGFAQTARYRKPVGGKGIEGPSIRFAEAAARCLGNVDVQSMTTFENDELRQIRVTVTDLESNWTGAKDIVVTKTVERRNPRQGDEVISMRENSTGQKVYLVKATEDDLLNRQAALESKAIRNGILRILPGDLLDEAMSVVMETLTSAATKDPDGERRRLVDAFNSIGVKPTALAEYLGHDLDALQPAEIVNLRSMFQAIRDGEATWKDLIGTVEGNTPSETEPKSGVAAAKARLRQRAAPSVTEPGIGEEAPPVEGPELS